MYINQHVYAYVCMYIYIYIHNCVSFAKNEENVLMTSMLVWTRQILACLLPACHKDDKYPSRLKTIKRTCATHTHTHTHTQQTILTTNMQRAATNTSWQAELRVKATRKGGYSTALH